MLISIVVPIYKVEDCLSRCVESILNQTYSDIEIILVDDGSPDKCPKLCDEYKKVDNRVKVIHKPNGGLSDARNAGMMVATGKYIMFVDSDDYIELDACEKLQRFENEDADILVCDGITEGGECNLSHFSEGIYEMSGEKYIFESITNGKYPIVVWLNVYKREFLVNNKLNFKNGFLHEDEDFTPRAFLNAKKIIHTSIFLYHYIIRSGSITQQLNKRKNVKDVYVIMKDLESFYREYSFENPRLRNLLLDLSVRKYLSTYFLAKAYDYEKEYTNRLFCLKNSKSIFTFIQSTCFFISPKLFCCVKNNLNKIIKK